MLTLKPLSISATFVCPDCGCKYGEPQQVTFLGTHILADCICECCENYYYHTLPTGHAAIFPISFSKNTTNSRFDPQIRIWLAEPLINTIRTHQQVEKLISKQVFKEAKEVILLNCLDSCYGHVFLKLLNAQYYLKNDAQKGLIILIPESFQWLLPEGIAEAWMVKSKLSDFNKKISTLDAFIKEEIKRFDTVRISKVPVHPNLSEIRLNDFLKTEPFDLTNFEKIPATITFILREDRFWLNTKSDAFLMKLIISKGWMGWTRNYFIAKQNKLIRSLVAAITKSYNHKIHFHATGLGKNGDLGKLVNDCRKSNIDKIGELEWCSLYAKSHIIIGVHGSNMLIPSALSAGFIEIVPRYKINNLTEDIAMNRVGGYMHFLGRYLDEFSSLRLIASHVTSMLNGFPLIKKNMEDSPKDE